MFYVLSFVDWDQNVQAVAKETDHRIIKKNFLLPPLVQYPKKKQNPRYYSNFVKWLAHVYLLEAILPQRAEVPVIPQKMAKWRGAMYGPCLDDW